jgi:TRAM domain
VVHVEPNRRLKVGEFVDVRITGSTEHDLHGVIA